MEKNLDAMTKVVEVLSPLSSEDRARVIAAALALLGEAPSQASAATSAPSVDDGEIGALPPRAKSWMNQNGIAVADLHQVFHMVNGEVEVISSVPGRNKKEQTFNAYILTGLGQLLSTGAATFTDKAARAFCEVAGCYDPANHAAYFKNRGNEFSGSKEKGWTLTASGLRRAAEIVRELGAK